MPIPTHEPQITERDLAFLRGLFESRVMLLAHAAVLYFGGNMEAAKKRTQRLKAANYIHEKPRFRAYDPSILSLMRRGFETLRQTGLLGDYPAIGWELMERRTHVSPFTLQHELDVLSAKAALVASLRNTPDHRLTEFCTWPRLFSFRARQQTEDGLHRTIIMKPDGFVRIETENPNGIATASSSFFVELDRSTETQQNLRGRASGYLDFYRTGGFAQRYGHPAERFREFPFRVLWIFRNAERRNNAAESFLQHHPPILTMPWLTTFDELLQDPLGEIWVRPIDYQHAVRESSFGRGFKFPNAFYRRQVAREQFVAARIHKLALLSAARKSDPSLDRIANVE